MTVTPPHLRPSVRRLSSIHPSISHLELHARYFRSTTYGAVPPSSDSLPALHFDGERRVVMTFERGSDAVMGMFLISWKDYACKNLGQFIQFSINSMQIIVL